MRQGVLPLLALCLALLAGCGGRPSEGAADAPEEGGSSGGTPAETAEGSAGSEGAENLFAAMPRDFLLCSGAGGWSTTLTIEADGSFSGVFHDSDMGAADPERFPNGTQYLCEFTGTFTQPEKAGESVWSMGIETLELAHPADGTEEVVDGVRYVYSGPYGLEEAEELRIYLPGTPVEELPEWAVQAARGPYDWQETPEGTLGLYEIYNVNEELGFVEYPRVTGEE